MKKYLVPGIAGVVIFIVGFFSGSEYKAYQLRSALSKAFDGIGTPSTATENSDSIMKQVQNGSAINKGIGDEIVLTTIKIKVLSSEEKTIINKSYGSPLVAKEGAKFVDVKLDITNITNSSFSFTADMPLVDNLGREFSSVSDFGISNSLSYIDLAPSIKQTGNIIYEVPEDATTYNLVIGKAGTKDVYQIAIK